MQLLTLPGRLHCVMTQTLRVTAVVAGPTRKLLGGTGSLPAASALPAAKCLSLAPAPLRAAAVSAMLTYIMWQRYARTGKLMPAGVVAFLR